MLIFVILCILILIIYWWILKQRYTEIGRVRRAYVEKVVPVATSPNTICNQQEIVTTPVLNDNKINLKMKPQLIMKSITTSPSINKKRMEEKFHKTSKHLYLLKIFIKFFEIIEFKIFLSSCP